MIDTKRGIWHIEVKKERSFAVAIIVGVVISAKSITQYFRPRMVTRMRLSSFTFYSRLDIIVWNTSHVHNNFS